MFKSVASAFAFNAFCRSVWFERVHPMSPQFTSDIDAESTHSSSS